jgi:enoyl-CoA hydratase/carnithine racemase
MRRQLGAHLEELAYDDDTKVVILRGEGGVFSTGADMNNAYAWYGDASKDGESNGAKARRPSQRRRLLVDRQTFDFYQFVLGYPKVTVAEVAGFALGGGLELALMADIAVVADDTKLGMPPPGSWARPSARCTSSSTGSARCWPAPAHRRHHRGRRDRPPRRVHRGGRA